MLGKVITKPGKQLPTINPFSHLPKEHPLTPPNLKLFIGVWEEKICLSTSRYSFE